MTEHPSSPPLCGTMCIERSTDMRGHVRRHVYRHAYRRAYLCISGWTCRPVRPPSDPDIYADRHLHSHQRLGRRMTIGSHRYRSQHNCGAIAVGTVGGYGAREQRQVETCRALSSSRHATPTAKEIKAARNVDEGVAAVSLERSAARWAFTPPCTVNPVPTAMATT